MFISTSIYSQDFRVKAPVKTTTIKKPRDFVILWECPPASENVHILYRIYLNTNVKENRDNYNLFIGQLSGTGISKSFTWKGSSMNNIEPSKYLKIKIVATWNTNESDTAIFFSEVFSIKDEVTDFGDETYVVSEGSLENIAKNEFGSFKLGITTISKTFNWELSLSADNNFGKLNTSEVDIISMFVLLPYQGKANISGKYFNQELLWNIPLYFEFNGGLGKWEVKNPSQSVNIDQTIYSTSFFLGVNFRKDNWDIPNDKIYFSFNGGFTLKSYYYTDAIKESIKNLMGTEANHFAAFYVRTKVIFNNNDKFNGTGLFLDLDYNLNKTFIKDQERFKVNFGIEVKGKVFPFSL